MSAPVNGRPLELFLLGSPHATLPNGQDVRFTVDNSLLLLAYLALNPRKSNRRNELAALLYPDHSEKQASVNLRQILLRLRRALADESATSPYLISTQLHLQFNSGSDVWLDTFEFQQCLDAVQKHGHRRLQVCRECMAKLDRAVSLYRGDFLSGVAPRQDGFFADWLQTARDDLRHKAGWALLNLADHSFQRQKYDESLAYLKRLLQMDAFNEAALRLEMQILALQGQRNRALQCYHAFQLKLWSDLEVMPEPETIQLAQAIRGTQSLDRLQGSRQHKDTLLTRQEFSASALPNTLIPFVSRTTELTQIAQLLSSRDCRLVTLTGIGGSGKTRLAMRAAADDVPAWEDGVWLVLLEAAVSSQSFEEILIQALGIPFEPTLQRRVQIYNFLREKEMLLVLDNFEQVVGQADFVKSLLDHAPRVKVIVTSRQRLGIRGEQVIEVQGLDFPPPNGHTPPGEVDSVNRASGYGAIQLFVQNLRRLRPGFSLNAENVDAVVGISRRLHGLPLALELAASWGRVFECHEILKRLEQDADFLTAREADVPARHASLRAVFEYSWKLLSLEERKTLGAISAFQDDLAPAAMIDLDPHLLAALRDKSLLQTLAGGRLGVHPQLHRFALEKFSSAG